MIMTPEDERDFMAAVKSEAHLCSWYNRQCNTLYKEILQTHIRNRPTDDKARLTPLGDYRVIGWLAADIELMDPGLLQLLEKIGRRDQHKRLCTLFAKATFDGKCVYGCT